MDDKSGVVDWKKFSLGVRECTQNATLVMEYAHAKPEDYHVPEVIVGDTEVLRNAPMEMIQAGYGDILGKFSCLNDSVFR